MQIDARATTNCATDNYILLTNEQGMLQNSIKDGCKDQQIKLKQKKKKTVSSHGLVANAFGLSSAENLALSPTVILEAMASEK